MVKMVVIVLTVVLSFSTVELRANSFANRDFDRAVALVKSGQEEQALVSLTDFLRRHPKHAKAAQAQFLLGEVEFRRRNFEDAVRELKKTLKYRKKSPLFVADAFFLVGESWRLLGQEKKALIEWKALIRAYPLSPAAAKAKEKLPLVMGSQ
jgi:TolA-binding protein